MMICARAGERVSCLVFGRHLLSEIIEHGIFHGIKNAPPLEAA
jgi:hypothetical protein